MKYFDKHVLKVSTTASVFAMKTKFICGQVLLVMFTVLPRYFAKDGAVFQTFAAKKGFRLNNEYVSKTVPATSVVDCSMLCYFERCCPSITYYEETSDQNKCELHNVYAVNFPEGLLLRDEHASHYKRVDLHEALSPCCFVTCINGGQCNKTTGKCSCLAGSSGSSCELSIGSSEYFPAYSCFNIKTILPNSKTGVYWINTANTTAPLQVFCDMDTYGGGWTLVYSYTFTNYDNFFDSNNAITPRPTWYAPDANVEISTVAPIDDATLGAMKYEDWKKIGEEFLIMSTINDWIVCKPDDGRLVQKQEGDILCVNIKNIATSCAGVTPSHISWGECGPRIYASTTFYRFDGSKEYCYPTHDPCDYGDTDNHKRNVVNPGGKIFLR